MAGPMAVCVFLPPVVSPRWTGRCPPLPPCGAWHLASWEVVLGTWAQGGAVKVLQAWAASPVARPSPHVLGCCWGPKLLTHPVTGEDTGLERGPGPLPPRCAVSRSA